MSVPAQKLTDKAQIRDLLMQDAIATAYQLGDLDEPYFTLCNWYGAGAHTTLDAVALLYTGLSMPVLLTFGNASSIGACLDAFAHELPGRMIAHIAPDHLSEVVRLYRTTGTGHHADIRPMVRMGLRTSTFEAASHSYEVETLQLRDTGDIIGLYQYFPDNFFEPAQLSTGHYYGVRMDNQLVAVAGVHVFAPDSRVACIGNIVTHPGYRGRGLSTACTSHLCSRLIEEGIDLFALNVDRTNSAATRVYQKLGFREHNTYLEGMLHSLAGTAL